MLLYSAGLLPEPSGSFLTSALAEGPLAKSAHSAPDLEHSPHRLNDTFLVSQMRNDPGENEERLRIHVVHTRVEARGDPRVLILEDHTPQLSCCF